MFLTFLTDPTRRLLALAGLFLLFGFVAFCTDDGVRGFFTLLALVALGGAAFQGYLRRKDFGFGLLLIAALLLQAGTGNANPVTINLCTGGEGQPYHQAGQMIARMANGNPNITIRVIKDTGGTWGNIERTLLGTPTEADYASGAACHVFIGQPDGVAYLARTNRAAVANARQITSLHREYVHALCSKESGIADIKKLRNDPTKFRVALGNRGSGAWLVWQNWAAQDKRYEQVPATGESGAIAISAVATNQTTCMLMPAGLRNGVVMEANERWADKVVLAEATDGAFDNAKTFDGKRLYEFSKIPGGTYPKIQSGWFSSSVETVSWEAGVYVNVERLSNERALSELITTIARARPGIVAEFNK
jgi:TRAP-type uncharacterized transport system substrate-binding protein